MNEKAVDESRSCRKCGQEKPAVAPHFRKGRAVCNACLDRERGALEIKLGPDDDLDRFPFAAERFWGRVAKSTNEACWPWTGSIVGQGYGGFAMRIRRTSIRGRAHRFAWRFANGTAPGDLFVCHSCDNRLCCNPGHLFLGTSMDNVHDMLTKGRSRSRHTPRRPGLAGRKLTDDQVRYVRQAFASGQVSAVRLAAQLHISPQTVDDITSGKTWKWLL